MISVGNTYVYIYVLWGIRFVMLSDAWLRSMCDVKRAYTVTGRLIASVKLLNRQRLHAIAEWIRSADLCSQYSLPFIDAMRVRCFLNALLA